MMSKFLFAFLLVAGVEAQTPGFIALSGAAVSQEIPLRFKVGTPLTLHWDAFTPAEIIDAGINRYHVVIDGGPPIPLSVDTLSYALPRFAPGPHTVALSACNPDECGPAVSLSFSVLRMTPPAVPGPKILPEDKPLNLEQAASMAHAYATLLRLRPLSESELTWLAARYEADPKPLTRNNVLSFLDRMALEIGQ
jgi:hypothetical protein